MKLFFCSTGDGRIRLEPRHTIDDNCIFLLVLHTVTNRRWCTDAILWYESCIRRFSATHGDLQSADANRGRIAL